MTVTALKSYEFAPRDRCERFVAPLLYVGWDDQMMYCAPVCLSVGSYTKFAQFVRELLPLAFGEHPEFAAIDWSTVRWTRGAMPWRPDPNKSLFDNGLRHKELIRFSRSGLKGF